MAHNRTTDLFLLVLLAASLLVGTWYLMDMRFRSGDIYPPYSSLRTDPLGCKALYDTLEHLPTITVRRHYTRIEDVDPQKGNTVFILGIWPWSLCTMERKIDRLAAEGANVVVGFKKPQFLPTVPDEENQKGSLDKETPVEAEPEEDPDAEEVKRGIWDIEMKLSTAEANDTGKYEAVLVGKSANLPGKLSLTSPVCFNIISGKWRELYTFEDGPVIVQRAIGLGTVTLLSDSYPVSNEALKWELHPDFLSWLLSDTGDVVFVESHLGVLEKKGVMTLVRKYRLTTLLFGFTIIALLAVWKNAVPLVPFPEKTAFDGEHVISEKDQFTGLVSLLKRNISPGSLIRICCQELKKGPNLKSDVNDSFEGSLMGISGRIEGDDPVKVYNRITKNLSERKKDEHRYQQHQ